MNATSLQTHDHPVLGNGNLHDRIVVAPRHALIAPSIELCLGRTAAGDAALAEGGAGLSPAAAALLQRIEPSRPIARCVARAPGASLADAMMLVSTRLVQIASCRAHRAGRTETLQMLPLAETLLLLPATDLYTVLTHQAKFRLGLIHGFRMVLALERCHDAHQQRSLAVRFIEEVWRAQGHEGLLALQQCARTCARSVADD